MQTNKAVHLCEPQAADQDKLAKFSCNPDICSVLLKLPLKLELNYLAVASPHCSLSLSSLASHLSCLICGEAECWQVGELGQVKMKRSQTKGGRAGVVPQRPTLYYLGKWLRAWSLSGKLTYPMQGCLKVPCKHEVGQRLLYACATVVSMDFHE